MKIPYFSLKPNPLRMHLHVMCCGLHSKNTSEVTKQFVVFNHNLFFLSLSFKGYITFFLRELIFR